MSQEFSINFNASLPYSFQFLNYLPGFHGHEINNQPWIFRSDFENCDTWNEVWWIDGTVAGFSLSWGNSVCIIKL